MKQKLNNLRPFLLGVLTSLLVIGMVVPALAATVTKSIEVRSGVRVFIDDQELIPKDAKGNPVEVFIYNGTTYLPARAISEAVGKPIQWDGSVQGVYIGKHSCDSPVGYLSQKDYFTKSGSWSFDRVVKDNLGNDHTHSMYLPRVLDGSVTYKLNGEYSRLTASLFQTYEYRDAKYGSTLIILGDGKQLWQGSVDAGLDPVNVDIDINVVKEGINIGSYTAGSNAFVRFQAEVVDEGLECGSNTLVSWGQAGVDKTFLQDYATVHVEKCE